MKGKSEDAAMPLRKPMGVVDTMLIALVMLLGAEDVDYLIFEKDLDEWKIVGWLRRN